MKQNPFRRIISFMVVLAMMCSMIPTTFAAKADQFTDFPQGWSKEAMTFAVNNGIINGKSETTIEPEANLTRAEMAAIINRAFGAEVADDISEYTDVKSDAWYYNDIGKAVHMETFHGDGNGLMRPDDYITREEVMAVLARALVLEYDDFSPINTFSDYPAISDWARTYLAALIGEGYVDGYEDGTLRPLANITREEFVQLMYNIFKTYLTEEGKSYNKVGEYDCVMINQPDITLSNVTINGDLVLGDGVGSGRINLNNVTIKGRLLARGGFITLTKVTTGKGVVVKNVNGRTHFFNWRTDSVFDGVRELTETTYLTSTSKYPVVGGSSGGGGGGGGSSSKKYEYTVEYYFQSADNTGVYTLDESRTVKGTATSGAVKKADIPEIENYVYNKEKSIEQITISSGTNELKIYYDLVTYKVNYTNPDGTEGTKDVPHGQKIGDAIDMPDTYTDDDGNKFDLDWIFTDPDGKETEVNPDMPVTGEGTLKPVLYAKVTFDYNYPGAESVQIKVKKGDAISSQLPADPSRNGYKFDGWSEKPDGTGKKYTADSVIDSPVTVYAVWVPESVEPVYHTVTFKYNYTGASEENYTQYTNILDGSKITKPADPERSGYTFLGWYKNAEGTVEFDFNNENITSDISIYAKWEEASVTPEIYTITFNSKGGTQISPSFVTEGGLLTRPSNPEKLGYEFVGWYTESECINRYNFNTPVTSSFTLYAKWEEIIPDTYTVRFETNGGSTINPITVTAGEKVSRPAEPAKPGNNFGGWYTDPACTIPYDFSLPVNASFTIYAKWIIVLPDTYIVEFVTDSDTVIKSQEIISGEKASKPSDPEKTGFEFGGWYTDTAFSNEYDFNTPVKEDITLYAKWIPKVYTVTFDSKDGSAVEPQEISHGEKAVKPENPTRDGFNFLGWYLNGEYYDFSTPVTGDIILSAEWEEIVVKTYVVTFETYGGTTMLGTPIKPQTVVHGELMSRPADPVKEGHDFDGWYTDDSFTVKFDFKAPVISDVTVYAKYIAHTFNITFETNGGSEIAMQTVSYGEMLSQPEAPVKAGYSFMGWYTDYELIQAYDFSSTVKNEFTLYAKWEIIKPNEYTVTFVNEGSTSIPKQTVIEGNKVIKPSTPRKTGYTFGGWYTDSAYANSYDFNNPVYSSFTLYAKWNINIYDIVFESNGGTPIATQNIPYYSTATEPENPKRDGYNFIGWYSNRACTLLYDFSAPVIKDMTLYAKWEVRIPNTYYVTFRTNGGSSVATQRIREGNKATEPTIPLRTGYTFDGWYSDYELNNKFDFDTIITTDTVLYAKWNINKYNVSFVTNCDETIAPQTVNYRNTATEPTAPTKIGYTFIGWYTDSGLSVKYNFATPITGDITLYGKWELNRYTVIFETGDGSAVEQQIISHGSKVSVPIAPEREGYSFGGWYADSNYGVEYDFDTAVTSDITIYAKWIINIYTVTFKTGEGSPVDDQKVEHGSKVIKPLDPTREGYTFDGWYTNSAFTNLYDFDMDVVGDKTLYAKWNIITYTVTFDSNEGSYVRAQTVNHGSKATKPADPVREGYTFGGWYSDEALTTVYDFETAVTADKTVYAKWTIKTYKVTFDTGEGSSVAEQTVNHGSKVTKPADPEREGYTFDGWYADAGFTTPYDFEAPVTGTVSIYAKWTGKTYKVTFETGEGSSVAEQTVNHGSKATKPADPVREGYTFDGWYADEALTTVYDFDSVVTSDKTVYAKWTLKTYKVTFETGDGTVVAEQTVNHGSKVTKPADPVREGYTFDGWFADAGFTTPYDFETPVTGTVSIYAKWTGKIYKVTFETGEGSSVAEQIVNHGSKATKPADPVREGYTFDGWYADEALTTVYDFDSVVTSDKTVYANWTIKTYKVTFDTGEGSAVAEQTVNHGSKATKPADPVREGYSFGGWYSDDALTTVYDFETAVTSDKTVYAKWIDLTEKFKVDFYYGVNEKYAYVGTADDITAGTTVSSDTYEKIFEDEGIVFENEGLPGYVDGSYTHMIYPELRYQDADGNWQIFDDTTVVASDMKVYYTFKYIQLMIDGNFLGINLDNVSLNTHYASDTRFMDSLKDAMYLSRNPINNGLKGKDAEIIAKLSDATGFIDSDGYVEIKPFALHIAEIIDSDDIHKEIENYIENSLSGTEAEIRRVVEMADIQDIIDCIGASNLSDVSVDSIVEYIMNHKSDADAHAKLVSDITDVIENYDYFSEFMDSFYSKKAEYEIKSDTVKLAKGVADAVYSFSDDEIITLLRDKGFGSFIDIYGEAEFKNMFAQSQQEYYDGVYDAIETVDNTGNATTYTTKMTVRVNMAEMLGSVSGKFTKKLADKLSGGDTNKYYTENPYLKEFVEQDIMEELFVYNPSVISKTNSGYKIKNIIEYYDIALENLILVDKALLWYGDLSEEERDELRGQYAADMVTMFADINNILAATQNGGDVLLGYNIDELIRLTDKVSSMLDKLGENSLGGLEDDINMMMGDVKYYLEKLENDAETPSGFTVAELASINNKLSAASSAYGNKDFATANDLYADAIAQIMNHIAKIVNEIYPNGTIDGNNFEEKLSHIPFVNRFSSQIIGMIASMAEGGFVKEYTKETVLETFDVERIESIIIGHDAEDRFTIDTVVDYISGYIQDNKVDSPEHSADEIVIDQYEKISGEDKTTLRRYIY